MNKIKNFKRQSKYLFRLLKREEYLNSFNEVKFKFDGIIHYLTWRCNSKCITCNCWKTPFSVKDKEVWNIENLKKLYSTLVTNSVCLTGGEPMILPKFKEIALAIHQASKAKISFATNGLIPEKIKKDLLWLKEKKVPFSVDLSCNGFEKTHDFSRGLSGNYQKILELIRFFDKNKFQFNISYTIFPFNISETFDFVKYWREKNIFVGIGIGRIDERYKIENDYKKHVFFNKNDYFKTEALFFRLSKVYPDYLPQYYLVRDINRKKKFLPCFALVKKIVIDPYGNVYPCDGLMEKLWLGDLKDTNFDFNLFIRSKKERLKEIFEIIRDKKCQPCDFICDLLEGELLTLSKKDLIKYIISRANQKLRPYF